MDAAPDITDDFEFETPLWCVRGPEGVVVEFLTATERAIPLFTDADQAERFVAGGVGFAPVELPTMEIVHAIILTLRARVGLSHVAIDYPPRGVPVARKGGGRSYTTVANFLAQTGAV